MYSLHVQPVAKQYEKANVLAIEVVRLILRVAATGSLSILMAMPHL